MNVLILEDEEAAARYLQSSLRAISPDIKILTAIESVRNALEWFGCNPEPDLIISDIQLADGTCFEIFTQLAITAPVIFTTAYDEYMQQAFKLHSIDYLLKPIDQLELSAAVNKHNMQQRNFQRRVNEHLLHLIGEQPNLTKNYKSRFLIKTGDRLSTVSVDNIRFLQAEERIVFLYEEDGRKYIIDEALDYLERVLDPKIFFRLNRRYIAPITSIEKINYHFNGKLQVWLKDCTDKEIFISREKVKAFKLWLGS